jgi:UPF0176 protein
MSDPAWQVAALYRFAPFGAQAAAFRAPLQALCDARGVIGTLLLAPEGINGTLAGQGDGLELVLDHIRALPGCAALSVKRSTADAPPFYRMKVRLKREIVTLGAPDLDPVGGAGRHVAPQDWNALIADPGTVVIDTRNAYEVAVGTFAGAIDPGTRTFRDFPDWFRAERARLVPEGRPVKVAMFCTGGIRCEKATALLRAEGVEEVYHLDGGILRYLEDVPEAESLWQGECFVFDERVAVGHGLAPGTHSLCRGCRRPVSPADRAHPAYVEGISCAACIHERDDLQRAGYAERQRQVALAAGRGQGHVGVPGPRTRFPAQGRE